MRPPAADRARDRAQRRRASTGATSCGCARWSRALGSITAGNGAIYAVRRSAYVELEPGQSHDIGLPFRLRRARPALALRAGGGGDASSSAPPLERSGGARCGCSRARGTTSCAAGCSTRAASRPLYFAELISHRLLRYATRPAARGRCCCAALALATTTRRARAVVAGHALWLGLALGARRRPRSQPARRLRLVLPRRHRRVAGRARPDGLAGAAGHVVARRRGRDDPSARFDVLVAVAALVVTAPLMLVIAVLIRLEDRGPALLRQSRVGLRRRGLRALQVPDDGPRRARARHRLADRGATTRASRASAGCCASGRSTSCRSSSTCCAAR